MHNDTSKRSSNSPRIQARAVELQWRYVELMRMPDRREQALAWLRTPSEIWDGRIGRGLIQTGRIDCVLRVVHCRKEGAPLRLLTEPCSSALRRPWAIPRPARSRGWASASFSCNMRIQPELGFLKETEAQVTRLNPALPSSGGDSGSWPHLHAPI